MPISDVEPRAKSPPLVDPDRGAKPLIEAILTLRFAVGLLGEREQAGWWQSSFMSPTSSAFLLPVFGGNIMQARYLGIVEAGKRVHDERIGIGRVFHLFRLPEATEQHLFDALSSKDGKMAARALSPEAANEQLSVLAVAATEAKQGPLSIGSAEALATPDWLGIAAGLYAAAFAAGVQCFPYFSERR
jgi:hypothetical protein